MSRALKTALFLSVSLRSPPPSEAALLQHVQGRRGQTDSDSGHRVDRQRRAGQLHFTVSAARLSALFLLSFLLKASRAPPASVARLLSRARRLACLLSHEEAPFENDALI